MRREQARGGAPWGVWLPDFVVRVEIGSFLHAVEDEVPCPPTHAAVTCVNAFIELQTKYAIGKVDEISGPINESLFHGRGYNCEYFRKKCDKMHSAGYKLLPIGRFF